MFSLSEHGDCFLAKLMCKELSIWSILLKALLHVAETITVVASHQTARSEGGELASRPAEQWMHFGKAAHERGMDAPSLDQRCMW